MGETTKLLNPHKGCQLVNQNCHAEIIGPEMAEDVGRIMMQHPLWTKYGVTQESARRRVELLLNQGEHGLGLRCRGILAAFAIYGDKTFGDHGYLRLLGVDKIFAGQGLGGELLDLVEKNLGEHQVDRLFCLCNSENQGALRFYQHRGFVVVGSLPGWTQPHLDEVILVKRGLARGKALHDKANS